jgi:hypothetical protein
MKDQYRKYLKRQMSQKDIDHIDPIQKHLQDKIKIYDEYFTPEKLVAGRRKTRKNKKRTLRKKRKSSKK